LYLPGELLDLAEDLARRAGAGSPQLYCEGLLVRALRMEEIQQDAQVGGIVASAMDALDGFVHEESLDTERDVILDPAPPTDPAPATGPQAPRFRIRVTPSLPGPADAAAPELLTPPIEPPEPSVAPPSCLEETPGRAVALRHAALEAPFDAGAFLVQLRRGQAVASAQVSDLLAALASLEHALGDGQPLDRQLARALHRLAYEPQVLITEAWPALARDLTTLQVVREVQSAAERIFEPGVGPPARLDARRSP
jgi:hypothetical protein